MDVAAGIGGVAKRCRRYCCGRLLPSQGRRRCRSLSLHHCSRRIALRKWRLGLKNSKGSKSFGLRECGSEELLKRVLTMHSSRGRLKNHVEEHGPYGSRWYLRRVFGGGYLRRGFGGWTSEGCSEGLRRRRTRFVASEPGSSGRLDARGAGSSVTVAAKGFGSVLGSRRARPKGFDRLRLKTVTVSKAIFGEAKATRLKASRRSYRTLACEGRLQKVKDCKG
ncbi:hypothetical protein GUJ93_ZPchr0004g39083 [Zizania palustris]|uniref:Uncharacterized protein n=1 Tax=Zizania palustris TaxID=103762 RepID=A0A8J5S0V5_ZIZPA|nr:hypothetical protein GUJ93_ZPchr0004g39083 [Zizania palustris]